MTSNQNDSEFKSLEVAILTSTCNKYEPGTQTFYMQSLVPMKDQSNTIDSETNDTSNLVNKDSNIGLTNTKSTSVISLELPREVARNYPKKWIPPGTRFLVTFVGGDITKPQIVGRDF